MRSILIGAAVAAFLGLAVGTNMVTLGELQGITIGLWTAYAFAHLWLMCVQASIDSVGNILDQYADEYEAALLREDYRAISLINASMHKFMKNRY